MPKPKTVTVRKQKLPNKVTYVTVYLRACRNYEHPMSIHSYRFVAELWNAKCCRIIPYKLKVPNEKKK